MIYNNLDNFHNFCDDFNCNIFISDEDYMRFLLKQMPGHAYWLTCDNIYMGCNDLQAKDLGLTNANEISGLTNSDLHVSYETEILDKTNLAVIKSQKTYTGIECASMLNGRRNYFTIKRPLFDKKKRIIGMLGLSVDMSEVKDAVAKKH